LSVRICLSFLSLNDIASLVPVIDSNIIAASLLHLQMRVETEQDASNNSRSEHFGCAESEVDFKSDARQSSTAKTGNRGFTEWICVLPHRQLMILAGLVLPCRKLRNNVPKAGFGNARSRPHSWAQYMRTEILIRSAICSW